MCILKGSALIFFAHGGDPGGRGAWRDAFVDATAGTAQGRKLHHVGNFTKTAENEGIVMRSVNQCDEVCESVMRSVNQYC